MFTTAITVSNTAGEAMDDLLQARSLGDLNDGFSTLDEDASSQDLPKRDSHVCSSQDLMNNDVARGRFERDTSFASKPGIDATSDGDVEDNGSKEDKTRKYHKAEGKLTREHKPKDSHKEPEATVEPIRRRSKRQEEMQDERERAEKRAARSNRRTGMAKPSVA